jgi:hypothetical protein
MYVTYIIDHISISQCTKKVKFAYKCVQREYKLRFISFMGDDNIIDKLTREINGTRPTVQGSILLWYATIQWMPYIKGSFDGGFYWSSYYSHHFQCQVKGWIQFNIHFHYPSHSLTCRVERVNILHLIICSIKWLVEQFNWLYCSSLV